MEKGERFGFGENWTHFLGLLDNARIEAAEASLKEMLEVDTLVGKRFLDAGSGSGLFSLAARRLGAEVYSFDYDPKSVACTSELRRRYFPDDALWTIEEGSVLDPEYLGRLGEFDIVYSWGVLHHTGQMWLALGNVVPLVGPKGKLFIAIYNDQGRKSASWTRWKRAYVSTPDALKWIVLYPAAFKLLAPGAIRALLDGRFMRTVQEKKTQPRGMDLWRDVIDWVGGYPFEVAAPDAIFNFYRARGFGLRKLKTVGGKLGCNEYVFDREC